MPKLSPETIKNIVIIVLIALISPFVVNCFFAYPQTDDFCYSQIARSMGFFKAQYHVYVTWSNRYTSTALLSINPLVYKSLAGYKLAFALLILVQLTSIYLLTDAITKKILSWQEKIIFALAMLFAFIDQMDDIRSGLYWMAGVITYQVAETLLFSYIALLMFMRQGSKYDNMLNKCLVIMLAILLGGTNEIVMALTLLITSLVIISSYAEKKFISSFQIVTFMAVIAGSSICLLAPGNFNRMSDYHDRKNIIITAWYALNSSIAPMQVWLTSPLTLILMAMVMFAVISKPQLRILFGGFRIVSSVFLLLLIMFICFFIPYFGTGMYPQNRVVNMIYLFFLIGLIINVAIISAHYGETIQCFMMKIPFKTGCIIVAAFMFVLLTLGTSNFMLVTKDLISGHSFSYYEQMRQRESQVVNSDKDDLTLEEITSTPGSLFFYFIGQDKDYWVNSCYAKYFDKKSVALINNRNCKPLN